jgi:RimJ/RimL family protein N-acetyltransferase
VAVSLRLEPFTHADIERLLTWIPSEQLLYQWAASGFTFPLTVAQLERHLAARSSGQGRVFKGLDDRGTAVGHLEFGRIDPHNRALVIGRVMVAPTERGRGVGTALMQAAIRVAFDDLQMHRVELSVFDFNRPAIACYTRVGFQPEGRRRDVLLVGATYWSEIVMSLLAPEWAARTRPDLT